MMKSTHLLLSTAVILATAATACGGGDDSSDDGGTGGSATGGTTGTGGSVTNPNGTVLQPSDMGWMDRADTWNDLGIQGAWYPYGDQYGEAKCTGVGMHPASDCSVITVPDPTMDGFPNTGGVMCTTGEVAVILECMPGVTTSGCDMGKDYSNMWGAGIGFDLNSEGGSRTAPKSVWDPMMVAPPAGPIIGFEFEIDNVPLQGLRVEVPIKLAADEIARATPPMPAGKDTTDDHPDGAPYWNATSSYNNSPVMPGVVNRVLWTDIKPPRPASYTFETSKVLGIQFHVPAVATAPKGAYSFCVKNFTFIRQ
jgi:hypothetical protein